MRGAAVPTDSAEGLLVLMALPGVGRQSAAKAASRFGVLGHIADATDDELREVFPARSMPQLRSPDAWSAAWRFAESELETAARLSVRIISRFEKEYPAFLAKIPDAPLMVYAKGTLPSDRAVACVGTREPSVFGVTVARRLTRFLASQGWGIVSGLAVGIDAECHEAALSAGGYTVAVLANGLDTVYPRSNAALADRIIATGGALLSEQPFGTRAFASHLIQRDRLQSGLSRGTVVMQTDVTGGTMHTVRYTLLQGRRLFVPLPTGPHREEPKSRGLIALSELPGRDLAPLLQAKEEFLHLLETRFKDRPVAYPIRGVEDYEACLKVLEETNPAANPACVADWRPGVLFP
jgi:DNA processing protein